MDALAPWIPTQLDSLQVDGDLYDAAVESVCAVATPEELSKGRNGLCSLADFLIKHSAHLLTF